MKKSCGAKTLALPTPVWVICSYNHDGGANAMTASWAGICCSQPAAVSVSLRAATLSHGNIKARSAFTVCIPSERHVKEADFFGLKSGRELDKLKGAGLTAARSELVDAPYIEEFPVIIECRLSHTLELGLHTLFVGEIADVKADAEVLGERESPTIAKVRPFLFDPGERRYYRSGEVLAEAFGVGKDKGARC